MKTSSLLLFALFAIVAQGCEQRPLAPKASGAERDAHKDSRAGSDRKEMLDEMESLHAQFGVRCSRNGDIDFIGCGMLPGEANGMTEVLSIFKQQKIELALPDYVLHGVGVWSIATEDFDRAMRVVEQHDLRHRFPKITFATSEEDSVEENQN